MEEVKDMAVAVVVMAVPEDMAEIQVDHLVVMVGKVEEVVKEAADTVVAKVVMEVETPAMEEVAVDMEVMAVDMAPVEMMVVIVAAVLLTEEAAAAEVDTKAAVVAEDMEVVEETEVEALEVEDEEGDLVVAEVVVEEGEEVMARKIKFKATTKFTLVVYQ